MCLQHPRIVGPFANMGGVFMGSVRFVHKLLAVSNVLLFHPYCILLYCYSSLDDTHHTFKMEITNHRLLHFATHFHRSQVHTCRKHPEACQPQGTACATACGAPGACATTNACQGQACPSPYLSVEPKAGQGGARASCMFLSSWQM